MSRFWIGFIGSFIFFMTFFAYVWLLIQVIHVPILAPVMIFGPLVAIACTLMGAMHACRSGEVLPPPCPFPSSNYPNDRD